MLLNGPGNLFGGRRVRTKTRRARVFLFH
jgi:hypothetical protein